MRTYRDYSKLGEGLFFLMQVLRVDYSTLARFLPKKFYWTPHIKAKELKRNIPKDIFNRSFKFAFIRNPWDWHVSMYHYIKTKESHPRHHEVVLLSGFEEFLEWWIENGVQLQKEYIADEKGEIIVDYIGRFENLTQDFNFVCSRLSITTNLPHEHKTDHENYRKYYNSRTRTMVKYHLGEDIELFKYRF